MVDRSTIRAIQRNQLEEKSLGPRARKLMALSMETNYRTYIYRLALMHKLKVGATR